MLVWQSRLNKKFPLEFVIQEVTSGGRGKIRTTYHRGAVANSHGARAFQAMLALKLVEQAQQLLDDVDAGIRLDVVDLESEERVEDEGETVTYEVEGETVTYEVEQGEATYEIEVLTTLEVLDVKRSFWARFRPGRRGKRVRAMEQIEIEYDGVTVEMSYGEEE
jgi:hypothetical protein|tara:strand:- start:18 stop:509 length:492 start_codon:yes stop_codon:yes gene_type:complete